MIDCKLFSEKERAILQTAFSKSVSSIHVYSLEYKGGLNISAFIQISFEMDASLTIATGKFADNIVILNESDFLDEKEKYSAQDDVEMKLSVLSNFEKIIDEKLLNVECIQKPDEEYYWQLNLVFGKKVLHVDALIDQLGFSVIS